MPVSLFLLPCLSTSRAGPSKQGGREEAAGHVESSRRSVCPRRGVTLVNFRCFIPLVSPPPTSSIGYVWLNPSRQQQRSGGPTELTFTRACAVMLAGLVAMAIEGEKEGVTTLKSYPKHAGTLRFRE
ncbi:hypothetical protein BJV82DRAFT_596325 [Fennellomyces sp. T-0311]|nr:hypothetical protein BJV82DRAFT_596325 [Fennellomyces sp. T-0311]